MTRSLVRRLLVVLPLFVSGCGLGLFQQGPSDRLRSYAEALRDGRADDAYQMLSGEAKRSISIEAFRRAVKDNPREMLDLAEALSRPTTDPEVTATLSLPEGEDLTLVLEGGRWKIHRAAIDLYGQATPRQVLMGFLRAYDRKRYDVILRYVPETDRKGTEPSDQLTVEKLKASWEGPEKDEMSRIVQAVRAALPNAVIEETGDSASMSYGGSGTVLFSREKGLWKIATF